MAQGIALKRQPIMGDAGKYIGTLFLLSIAYGFDLVSD